LPLSRTSSENVFHSLHAGHFPNHLALSCPQLLQKKAVFILLIATKVVVRKRKQVDEMQYLRALY
jgi:hypothetical protein